MGIIDKLKARWGIKSTFQVFIILIVFACTGFTALFAREFVFDLLGVTDEFPFWQRALIWIVTILPLYNLFLYIYGVLFGQREFFTLFLKKTLGRIIPGKKNTAKKEA
ncbi:MAG TPA: prolipoprotein diacylglyceryl transferase [Balneola sp.]|nr:prolipoprotein diacylglyceryl transferase [Balneola sp.]HCT51470.1 prolipoprotein diacylglyceryl transferase [Balneola sp.]|tara:strand:+ start:1503 stop:1826 length:324 start_codon:yes stop_codon:yes gene_type:complete